jgi:hypothetical protein
MVGMYYVLLVIFSHYIWPLLLIFFRCPSNYSIKLDLWCSGRLWMTLRRYEAISSIRKLWESGMKKAGTSNQDNRILGQLCNVLEIAIWTIVIHLVMNKFCKWRSMGRFHTLKSVFIQKGKGNKLTFCGSWEKVH